MQFEPVTSPPKTLSPEQVERFNHDGYVAPLPLFSDDEADVQRTYLDGLLGQVQRWGGDAYDINAYHHVCQGIYDIATHPKLLDYVEDLIGPDIICWGTHYFCKMPHDAREVPFHQDAPYWPFRPARAVTAWIAIDDVRPDAGPMCFLPGSHLQGRMEWQRRTDDVVLELEVKDQSELNPPTPLLLSAGQVSLHTDLLVHGSNANTSDFRRCGLTLRYVPPEVWIKDDAHLGWTASSIHCRGQDPIGRWPNNPRPNATFFHRKDFDDV